MGTKISLHSLFMRTHTHLGTKTRSPQDKPLNFKVILVSSWHLAHSIIGVRV